MHPYAGGQKSWPLSMRPSHGANSRYRSQRARCSRSASTVEIVKLRPRPASSQRPHARGRVRAYERKANAAATSFFCFVLLALSGCLEPIHFQGNLRQLIQLLKRKLFYNRIKALEVRNHYAFATIPVSTSVDQVAQ